MSRLSLSPAAVLLLGASFAVFGCSKKDNGSVDADDAAAKAASQITPENAHSEADRLIQELDNELK